MAQLNNTVEVLKLLDKSNCKKCHEPTCLTFAVAVARGQKALNECVCIEEDVINRFSGESRELVDLDGDMYEVVNQLKGKLRTIDLAEAAKRHTTPFKDGILTLKIFGKNFSVDSKGRFSSEIHTHSGLTLPVLNYILEGAE